MAAVFFAFYKPSGAYRAHTLSLQTHLLFYFLTDNSFFVSCYQLQIQTDSRTLKKSPTLRGKRESLSLCVITGVNEHWRVAFLLNHTLNTTHTIIGYFLFSSSLLKVKVCLLLQQQPFFSSSSSSH